MSKDNRDMSEEKIEKKFYYWLEKITGMGFRDSHIPLLEIGFGAGYCLAEKELQEKLDSCEKAYLKLAQDKESNDRDYLELSAKHNVLQEKLDAAIEIIRWYMDNSPEKGGCVDDNFTYVIRHIVPSNKRARDFLKARGE